MVVSVSLFGVASCGFDTQPFKAKSLSCQVELGNVAEQFENQATLRHYGSRVYRNIDTRGISPKTLLRVGKDLG